MSTINWMWSMWNLKVGTLRGQANFRAIRESEAGSFRDEKGFTLIEMLTVVGIIGILSSVAIPSFANWLDKYRADSEATRLYFNLMASKQRAIRNNSTIIVTFTVASNTYTIHDDLDEDGSVDIGENVAVISFESDMVFGIAPGVLGVWGGAVSNPIALNGSTTVKFFSAGRADSSGAIYIIPGGDLALGIKGNQRAIKIVQATGNLEVMKFNPSGTPGPWS